MNMNGPPMMMGGGYPPNQQPPFNYNMGPPQQQQQQHMQQMQMPPGQTPPPHLQPPSLYNGVPSNMMRSQNQMQTYGQGFVPQTQPQHMNQLLHPQQQPQQYQQQHPPPQINMQLLAAPGMTIPQPQQYSLYQPQQPQSMQQPQPQQPPNMQQQISQSATSASTVALSAGWTEHKSPTGVPYYYNTITKVSTYDRAVALGGSTSTMTPPPPAAAAMSVSKWQTFTDESTGKKYYSDGVQTTWTCPAELSPEEGNSVPPPSTKKKKSGDTFEDDDRSSRPKKKKIDNDNTVSLYANKAEAVAAFKGLLLAKDIAPSTKWVDVVRICSDDTRWEACTTIGERKQALAEYQTKRANELKDVKRQEKVRAKEAYHRLLTDVLPASKTFVPGTSRFMDVRDLLSKDDRFYAVEDETTREESFFEWVEELRKKEERTKHNKKREAKEGCIKYLKSKEEEGKLTFASTWSSFMSSLTDTEKSDPRFQLSTNMNETDRQLYFADYIIELSNVEDEKRRRIRDARQRAEKAQRDAFRERLIELAKAGMITPETRWRSIEDKVANDPTYGPVQVQGRDVARELFEDFVYDWREEYRRDKVTLLSVWDMRENDFDFVDDSKTNVDEFGKMMLEWSSKSSELYGEIRRMSNREVPMSSIHLFFNDRRNMFVSSINGSGNKRLRNNRDESSEDEGEIIEDGEIADNGNS
jgi:pre-mRNA-processing factor 40